MGQKPSPAVRADALGARAPGDAAAMLEQLAAHARLLYERGWMVGTSGNLSWRDADGSIWISASGRSKGRLGVGDFVRLDRAGAPIDDRSARPSAETSIHVALYRRFAQSRVCYHVHSVEANLAGRLAGRELLELPALEMLKGFGIRESTPQVSLPVFDNHVDVGRIAEEIALRFGDDPPRVPALMIRDHGVTVWADGPQQALDFLELLDYLLRFVVEAHRCGL